jgi:hypothetical protein
MYAEYFGSFAGVVGSGSHLKEYSCRIKPLYKRIAGAPLQPTAGRTIATTE